MTEKEINGIIEENSRRREALASPYNPVTGEGSPLKRVKVSYFGHGQYWSYSVPVQMYEDNKALLDTLMKAGSIEDLLKQREINSSPLNVNRFINDLTQLRFKYDFEFWAYITARIQDKETKKIIPFKLNKPQLKTLAKLEKMRLAGEPIRAIILKARQWGGSTLIQIYMAWIQIIHRKNWHSVIVTDVEDQARNIRGMYSRFAKEYPVALEKIELVPFEGSSKTKMIQGRNCIVGVGSVQKPESLRSYDFAMAHLSEVGSWKATLQKSPEDLAQSIRASIPDVPLSLEVLESTAKGVGNFFHREWLSAVNGVSSYEPIFIAWFEIPRYQKKIRYCEKFIQDNFENEYVQILWNLGATLEGINWYISFKKGKNYDDWRMNNEYPSTCISKGVRIGTNKGIMPIEDCMVSMDSNYGKILKVIDNGVRETYRLITKNGYELKCTNDHLIKMKPGFYNPEWKPLCDIRLGDRIELSPPMFSDEIYTLKWSENFVNYSITITPELARFIGIFMGDGSYSGECLSIACDAQDRDFIDSTKELINNLLGVELHERLTGKNKGCCEIRVSKKGLTNYFLKLGIVERVEYGYKRRVCVPDCIWKSPDNIIAEFIKGVLETDGFNGYKSAKVVLFSSHVSFLKDIQLLLLGFGITSKFDKRETTNGGGYKYLANTLNLNGEQADLFNRKIGFLSERKINNWRKCTIRCITKRTKNILYDSVLSITPLGYEQVYDLTIENRPQFSANGILVHNCNEAFSSSDMRVFNPKYVLRARESCIDPEFIGELSAQSQKGKEAFEKLVFMLNSKGNFFIWSKPDKTINVSDRYVVSVDIGGRSDGADYSVIKVIDRYWMMYGGGPETVSTWRGHCFVPGTLIYTSEGFKKIEDVNIGDLVWTHKNRFRKVLKTYKNKYEGEILSIRSQGNYETVTCTPEHPFFSNKVTQDVVKSPWKPNRHQYHKKEFIGEPDWVKAIDLKYIAYSRAKQNGDITNFIINKYNGGRSKDTERFIKDLHSFYSILGYYLAEGHINKRCTDKVPSSICFSFSYQERNTVAKDCYDKIIKLGFKASLIEYKSVGICRVRAYDTNLAKFVLELCGEHSWNKRLSPVILKSHNDLLSELIDSYWKGDGSTYKTDQSISNTITTVSPLLARQIRDILIILGHRPGIYRVVAKTCDKKIKSQRPRYNVVWSASEIKKNATLLDDENVVYKVKSKENRHFSGYVYNLEVEEDNSYSTACYVVHNCDQDLVAWKAAQIARWYNNALLIVESNSLDKDAETEGTHFLTILDEIVKHYSNIYARTDPEKVRMGLPIKYGFQTTMSTKPMVIDILNAALREDAYIERDLRACDELDTYEIKKDGSYGAVDGCHDDIVMTTAIGLWACFKYLPLPKNITRTQESLSKKIVSEATI